MKLRIVLVLATALIAGVAQADVTISMSNEPSANFDSELSSLFGQENSATASTEDGGVVSLVTPRGEAHDAFEELPPKEAWLAARPTPAAAAELKCMAEALYFEARGESLKGQFAVAEVIMNRVASPSYPNTVCGVVHQGNGKRYGCQFTYTCDGHPEQIRERGAYTEVSRVAAAVLGGVQIDLTEGATFYHTQYVRPSWSKKFVKTASIGTHEFYRRPTRVAQR
jgi:spore germination cell wall hydrolase CwlJ-like protein